MDGGASAPHANTKQSNHPVPYPDSPRHNPHLPQPKGPRLTQEEINILEECNTESFWYRSLPLAVAFGGTTAYLVKTGHLRPHPRYGATLKTMGAVFVAYVMGKVSYQSTCQQKILEKIPHSNLAQSVRKSRGMVSISDGEMESEMGAVSEYKELKEDKMRDMYSSIDSSTGIVSRNVKELDDNFRPTMDREVKPREAAADQENKVTYTDLRQRNRLEYERSMALSPNSPLRQRPFPVPNPGAVSSHDSMQPPAESVPPSSGPRTMLDTPPSKSPSRTFDSPRGGKKNEYGDVWDSS